MKIFVMICNAKKHSSKEEYIEAYISEALKNGHEVRTVNIYDLKMDYLRFDEEKGDFDYSLTEELKQAQENSIWADQLVFVYPVWGLAIPPIMSTFMKKVLSEDVSWRFTKYGPKPLMKGKTAVIMHSYIMPHFWLKFMYLDLIKKWWKIVLTDWRGPKIIKIFDFDKIDSVTEERKQKWIKDVKKFVSKL